MNEHSKEPLKRSIPFARVICDGNELRYVTEVIQSGWLTTAGKCMEFEKCFAEKLGARFACAVNSATAALHLACEAVGIGRGDKVFVPTLTFTATAEVIRYLGADPVFLDIEYGTGLVTPEILENAITACPEAKALIVVHFGGQAADLNGIKELCKRNGLVLIEDAAHAFPARYDGRMVGAESRAACFSFYANKTITTGEGGMLVTDSEAIYKRAKIMRLHGIDRDIWDRFTAEKPQWEYDVVAPGTSTTCLMLRQRSDWRSWNGQKNSGTNGCAVSNSISRNWKTFSVLIFQSAMAHLQIMPGICSGLF